MRMTYNSSPEGSQTEAVQLDVSGFLRNKAYTGMLLTGPCSLDILDDTTKGNLICRECVD